MIRILKELNAKLMKENGQLKLRGGPVHSEPKPTPQHPSDLLDHSQKKIGSKQEFEDMRQGNSEREGIIQSLQKDIDELKEKLQSTETQLRVKDRAYDSLSWQAGQFSLPFSPEKSVSTPSHPPSSLSYANLRIGPKLGTRIP